jgi:hypothetical protein
MRCLSPFAERLLLHTHHGPKLESQPAITTSGHGCKSTLLLPSSPMRAKGFNAPKNTLPSKIFRYPKNKMKKKIEKAT